MSHVAGEGAALQYLGHDSSCSFLGNLKLPTSYPSHVTVQVTVKSSFRRRNATSHVTRSGRRNVTRELRYLDVILGDMLTRLNVSLDT